MSRKGMQCKESILVLLVALAVLAACAPGAAPTPTPTPPPVQVSGWQEDTLHTVCLWVDQSYPQIEHQFSEPIAESATSLLTAMGLEVAMGPGHCHATLGFTLSLRALGRAYWWGSDKPDYCYSGAEVTGEVVLSIAERGWITLPVYGRYPTPDTIYYYCAEQPDEAPFSRAWPEAVLDGLIQLWGPPALIPALGDENTAMREGLVRLLERMGPEAAEVVPALIEGLRDHDAEVRETAAGALVHIAPKAVKAIPALVEALEDRNANVRKAAAEALGSIGPEAVTAVPALIEALEDDDWEVRGAAVVALGSMGPEAIPVLVEALGHKEPNVRWAAARALGCIGPEAVGAIPALIQALGDAESSVRAAASIALVDIGPEAVPMLIQVLRDEGSYAAAVGLIGIGPTAVPALIDVLSDEGPDARGAAAQCLKAITGQDFGEDASQWQRWWEEQE
jgi:HEAT repeat protein